MGISPSCPRHARSMLLSAHGSGFGGVEVLNGGICFLVIRVSPFFAEDERYFRMFEGWKVDGIVSIIGSFLAVFFEVCWMEIIGFGRQIISVVYNLISINVSNKSFSINTQLFAIMLKSLKKNKHFHSLP